MPFKDCQLYQKAFYGNTDHWRCELAAEPTVDPSDPSIVGKLKTKKILKTAFTASEEGPAEWAAVAAKVLNPDPSTVVVGGAAASALPPTERWCGLDMLKATEKDNRNFNEKHRNVIVSALEKGGLIVAKQNPFISTEETKTDKKNNTSKGSAAKLTKPLPTCPPITPFLVAKTNTSASVLLDCKGLNRVCAPPPRLDYPALGDTVQLLQTLEKAFIAVGDLPDWANQIPVAEPLQDLFTVSLGGSSGAAGANNNNNNTNKNNNNNNKTRQDATKSPHHHTSACMACWPLGFAWTNFVSQSLAMALAKAAIEYNPILCNDTEEAADSAAAALEEGEGEEEGPCLGTTACKKKTPKKGAEEEAARPLFAVSPSDRTDAPPTHWVIAARPVASFAELAKADICGMLSFYPSPSSVGDVKMLLITRSEALRSRIITSLTVLSAKFGASWAPLSANLVASVEAAAEAAAADDSAPSPTTFVVDGVFYLTKNEMPSYHGVQLMKARRSAALTPNEWMWGHLAANCSTSISARSDGAAAWPTLKKEPKSWRTAAKICDVLVFDWYISQQSHLSMRDVFAIVQRIGAIDFKKDKDWDCLPPEAPGTVPPFFAITAPHHHNNKQTAATCTPASSSSASGAPPSPAPAPVVGARASATQASSNYITPEEWAMLHKRLDYCCQKTRKSSAIGLQHFGGGDVKTRAREEARWGGITRTITMAADTAADKGAILVFGAGSSAPNTSSSSSSIEKVHIINYSTIPTHGPGSIYNIGHAGVMGKDMNWKETYIALEAIERELNAAERQYANNNSTTNNTTNNPTVKHNTNKAHPPPQKLYFHLAVDNTTTMAVICANCIPWCATLAAKAAELYKRLDAKGWLLRVTAVAPSIQPAFELCRGCGGSELKVEMCRKALKDVDNPWSTEMVKAVREE